MELRLSKKSIYLNEYVNMNEFKYIDKLEEVEEKIIKTRAILNYCYTNDNLSYKNKLEMSKYMDKLLNRYYELKTNF